MQHIKKLLDLNNVRKQSVETHLLRVNRAILDLETKIAELNSKKTAAQMHIYNPDIFQNSRSIYPNLTMFIDGLEREIGKFNEKSRALECEQKEHEDRLRSALASENYLEPQLRRHLKIQENKRELIESERLRQLHYYSRGKYAPF